MRFSLAIIVTSTVLALSACSRPIDRTTDIFGSGATMSQDALAVADVPDEPADVPDSAEAVHATGSIAISHSASGTVLIGNPGAKHRLTVVTDYDCPYCRQFTVADLPWIVRTFPELSVERVIIAQDATKEFPAKLALCALKQNRFTEADRWLLVHPSVATKDLKTFATDTGTNLPTLQKCLAEKDLLKGNRERAVELGAVRVPFFVLGEESWIGLKTRDELKEKLGKL